MKIICIEEHAVDEDIMRMTGAAVIREVPFMPFAFTKNTPALERNSSRPIVLNIKEASELALDMGAGRIKDMDAEGIHMQVLSYSSPIQLAPPDKAYSLARNANDRMADAVSKNPDRLAGFATLPWQDPDMAVKELLRAINELKMKGVLIMGRPSDEFLDAPRYSPILSALNDLKVPIYIHPFAPLLDVQRHYYSGFRPEVEAQFSLAGWGWHNEAGVHTLRLILSGAFDKYPNLQIISGHWGEMVPFYLQRLDDLMPTYITGLSKCISQIYREHVWVTPTGMFDMPHFEFINKIIGVDRIIMSTDYPYVTMDGAKRFLEGLPLSESDKNKIAYLNAEKLLGL